MSFIAKNPLILPETNKTPSPPNQGLRGIYVTEDGWYDIDSKNNTRRFATTDDFKDKANCAYLGGVNLNQIFEPGIYTIELRGSSYLPQEVNDLIESDSSRISTYATLKVSPYHLSKHEDDLYPVKNGGVQELTVYFFDEEWNSQVCVYINEVFTDLVDIGGEYGVMCNGWVKIADSRGMGGSSIDVDLSEYVKKEEGKGLSKVSEIIVTTPTLDEIGDYHEITFFENDANETSNTYDFFSTAQVTERLNLKADKTEVDEKLKDKIDKTVGSLADVNITRNDDGTETLSIYRHNLQTEDDGSEEWNTVVDDEHNYYSIDKIDEKFGNCVKNTDYATADKAGVVKVYSYYGLYTNADGVLKIVPVTADILDAIGNESATASQKEQLRYKPIVADILNYAVMKSTHQELSDDYDTTSLPVAKEFEGNQGKLPVSYDAVKAYIEETLLGGAW